MFKVFLPLFHTLIMSRKPLSGIQKQPPEMFCKKVVLKNFANFTGKYLCWSPFLIKMQAFRTATLLKRGMVQKWDQDPGTRNPPQSLKVRPQDLLQSLKVGPLHLSLMNLFYSEYLIVFYLCVFFK